VITFAVIGQNEERRLAVALGQALAAAGGEDRVWFVDSASTDGSAAVAACLGVEVLSARAGKGRAVAAALERCDEGYLCTIDADIDSSERNIPRTLAEALVEQGADMVVADFVWPEKRALVTTPAVYRRLVGALFPELLDLYPVPLCGFRIFDVSLPVLPLPPGFGVETHLNLAVPLSGGKVGIADLGTYHGPARAKPTLGLEVGAAVLDLAVRHGRLDRTVRPAWDAWLNEVIDVLSAGFVEGEPAAPDAELIAAAGRLPLPPVRAPVAG
jgi:Glycosyl transferase family 2